jgi:hypothetical protein
MHGAKSAGPRTVEGKAAVAAAMVRGRRKWLYALTAKGIRVPWGRKLRLKAKVEAERAARVEAERIAAMPPIERRREEALSVIAELRANLLENMEAR